MRRSIAIAGLLAILAGYSAAVPAWAQGCVSVEVSVSPEQACPGSSIVLTSTVTNCGELMDRITLSISGMGHEKSLPSFRLGAGLTKRMITVQTVPRSASAGSYTLTASANSSSGGYDSDDATLQVTSCP